MTLGFRLGYYVQSVRTRKDGTARLYITRLALVPFFCSVTCKLRKTGLPELREHGVQKEQMTSRIVAIVRVRTEPLKVSATAVGLQTVTSGSSSRRIGKQNFQLPSTFNVLFQHPLKGSLSTASGNGEACSMYCTSGCQAAACL